MSGERFMFNIGSTLIPCFVSVSGRAKHIRLIVDIDGLRVVKPPKAKPEEIEKLMHAKSNWIHKHYMKFQSMKQDQYRHKWEDGETVLYKGRKYYIRIAAGKGNTTFVDFDGEHFSVFVSGKPGTGDKNIVIEEAFNRWYKQTAREIIGERLHYYCSITGLACNQVRIKEQKTRWGSCSNRRNLNFNWRLIMAPQWVIDYVIIHEVCHLRYLNHSKEFWDMVGLYMPEYRKAREWLKKNGPGLNI